MLKNDIVEKLLDSLALPQIFQCVSSCGASLVARASTWSRVLIKCSETVLVTPASLLHCQTLHLALPSTERALFGLRVEWGISFIAIPFFLFIAPAGTKTCSIFAWKRLFPFMFFSSLTSRETNFQTLIATLLKFVYYTSIL